jgi:hypothetical protein
LSAEAIDVAVTNADVAIRTNNNGLDFIAPASVQVAIYPL